MGLGFSSRFGIFSTSYSKTVENSVSVPFLFAEKTHAACVYEFSKKKLSVVENLRLSVDSRFYLV
jgi:hypothetical protein